LADVASCNAYRGDHCKIHREGVLFSRLAELGGDSILAWIRRGVMSADRPRRLTACHIAPPSALWACGDGMMERALIELRQAWAGGAGTRQQAWVLSIGGSEVWGLSADGRGGRHGSRWRCILQRS